MFLLINSIYVSVKFNKRRKKGAKAIMRISWFLELVVTIIQWNLFFSFTRINNELRNYSTSGDFLYFSVGILMNKLSYGIDCLCVI